jgi:hypothetical protein
LLPLEISYLLRELVYLLLQARGFRRSIVLRHYSRTHQRQHAEQALDKALPGFH